MSEPTGHAADGTPWDEARGPHLPDRLTAVPLAAWPFVILAVVQVAGIWMANATDIARDIGWLWQVILVSIDDVAASLLGAALFVRHPGAIRTLPLVVVGVSLLALEQILGLLATPLRPAFEATNEAFGDETAFFYAASAYSWFGSLVGSFGILSIARGLDAARRSAGRTGRRLIAGLVLVSLLIVAGTATTYLLPAQGSGVIPVLAAGASGVTLVSLLATSYLVVIALAGWRAGEHPALGWALAVVSGAAVIAAAAVVSSAMVLGAEFSPLTTIFSLLSELGWLALLAAFLVGLPSTAQIEWEEIEPAAPTLDPPAATPPGSAGS